MQIYVKETQHANESGPTLVIEQSGLLRFIFLAALPEAQGSRTGRPWGPFQPCDVYSLGPEPRPVHTQR